MLFSCQGPPWIKIFFLMFDNVKMILIKQFSYFTRYNCYFNFSGRDELLKQIPNHDVLLCTSFDKVDSELLDEAGESLRCVASVSAGYNHVDTSQLASRGIVLGNTPDVLTDSVAEIGVVLVLDCLRNVVKEANKVSGGKWTPSTELFRLEYL